MMHNSPDAALRAVLAFASTYALLAILPGPNFLLVVRASLMPQRRAGLLAAAGVATGAGLLSLLSMSFAARLAPDPALATVAHAAFAAVLLLTGGRKLVRLLRDRPPAAVAASGAPVTGHPFLLGLATAAANPVSATFFGSYLVTSRTAGGHVAVDLSAAAVFLVAAVWFGAVALVLSTPASRLLLGRRREHLDALIALGLLMIGAGMLARLLPGP